MFPRSLRMIFGVALLALICVSCPLWVRAQSQPTTLSTSNNTGTNPYETYAGVRENINLSTGNLNLVIPILTLPGRAGHDLVLAQSYDSKVWQLRGMSDPFEVWSYWWDQEIPGSSAGWGAMLPWLFTDWVYPKPNVVCKGAFILVMPDGAKHSFLKAKRDCTYISN